MLIFIEVIIRGFVILVLVDFFTGTWLRNVFVRDLKIIYSFISAIWYRIGNNMITNYFFGTCKGIL
jgi:hypothetical protein